MDNPIVAGIINARTGEIYETTTNPSAKTGLHLKVRDELNAEHGAGAFLTFELDMMGGMGNLNYIQRNMLSDDPNILDGLMLLQARFRLVRVTRALEQAETELAQVNNVRDECLALYPDNAAKRNVVESAFDTEVNDAEETVQELRNRQSGLTKHLRKLEAEAAQ